MSRGKYAFLSLTTGVVGALISMILGIVATPLLLRWLGDERLGAYRVALEWLGYLAILDFGLTGTLQTAVAKRLGQGERLEALADVRYGMRRFVRVALLQIGLATLIAFSFGWLIRDVSTETLGELRWGVAVTCIAFLWIPLNALRPLLDAAQQSYWINFALLGQSVGATILGLFFAWNGWGLVGQFASTLIGGAIYTFTVVLIVSRRFPEIWQWQEDGPVDTLDVSWPMFVFNSLGRVSVLSDCIILGAFVTPYQVTQFYLTQRFIMLAASQVMMLGNATWAPLTDLHFRGERDLFRSRFLQINRLTAILAIGCLGPLAIVNQHIIGAWVLELRYGGNLLSWITLGQGFMMAILSFWAWPFVGVGKVRATLPIMLVGTIVNLAVSLSATYAFGIIGAALGTFISYLVVYFWWYPILLEQEFGLSGRQVTWEPIKAVLLFVPVGIALWYVAPFVNIDAITKIRFLRLTYWIAIAAATGAIYFLLAWKFLMRNDERDEWVQRAKQFLSHFTIAAT